ncbi:putative ubiquitin hydrolase [Trypanosoma rangeli]|uniref:Putative ubiquitin hydrolase n=1 Tax=Trypanosoma rangeli TaxID=5698 RepID=A0A422P4X3_TRYRA|nr:putative ubiquitin hydrolase [Trypanosoma rangeli]RNF12782.1 putative ubiquitin hydrolase [Trypanosoma rangeli]|eukprot:RNF12782.1 putative ubiquitin hydrolase [Trypanosoma rangeli]
MVCSCYERVDPELLRVKLARTWLTDRAVTTEPPALYCTLCERQGASLSTKTKNKGKLQWFPFSRTSKDCASALGGNVKEDLFMCLSCTMCFCSQHVTCHEAEEAKICMDRSIHHGRRHYLFFLVPSCAAAMNTSSASGKGRTVFPAFQVDDLEQIRGSGVLTLEKEANIGFRPIGDPQGWVYYVWCVLCSEKQAPLSASTFLETSKLHVHIKHLGDVIAKLLYLFYEGIQIEIPDEGVALSQGNIHSGDHFLYQHSNRQLCLNRTAIQDMDTFASFTSAGASSFALRGLRVDPDALALAHVAGIENHRNTCYFNSVLQCVLKCGFFTRSLLAMDAGAMPGPLTRRLYAMVHHLCEQTVKDVETHALYPYAREVLHCLCKISPLFAEDDQQDSQELFLCMINGVADELDKGKSEEEKKKGPRLSFEGVMRTEVVCLQCKNHIPREEVFMALSVPVEDSIEKGLEKLFRTVKLQEKDQYACERCFQMLEKKDQERHNADIQAENQRKEKSKKKAVAEEKRSLNCVYSDAQVSSSISRLGATLALHLLRFQCESRGFRKVTRNVAFPLSLDLTQFVSEEVRCEYELERKLFYLETRFPLKERDILVSYLRSTYGDVRKAERMIVDAEGKEVLNNAQGATRRSNVRRRPLDGSCAGNIVCHGGAHEGGDVSSIGDSSPSLVGATSSSERRQGPLPSLKRELVGIVAHRGSLHGGHYIAYVRDEHNPNTWFRCDDEEVEMVDKEYVLRCQSEVYMLFYE